MYIYIHIIHVVYIYIYISNVLGEKKYTYISSVFEYNIIYSDSHLKKNYWR